ncbi:MAG TPA: tetratricopeptide repeat protein, partial [Thermoanaerobaculia bacterium]|nr:tetratricopeptide repeat protein [Thermoanaerobaculia bacterium]
PGRGEAPPAEMVPAGQAVPAISEVFDLGSEASARTFAAGDDVFGLGAPPSVHAEAAVHVAVPAPAPGAHGDDNGAEPFPDQTPEHSRSLYLAGFAAEHIFWFDEVAEEPVPAAIAPPAAEEPVPVAITAPAAEPPTAEPPAVAPAAAAATAGTAATVTLAELYLRQGHTEEAERIFGDIVQREPGNAAAREGLARLTGARPVARQERLDAGQLLAGLNDPQASPMARRAYLLQSYLARLRPRRSHVP